MGYFNFYIIRKIIRYLFSNKKIMKILLIFIALFLLLVIKNKIFAVTTPTLTLNNKTYSFRNNIYNGAFGSYDYYAIDIWYTNNSTYTYQGYVYYSNSPIVIKPRTVGGTTSWYFYSTDNTSVVKMQNIYISKNSNYIDYGTNTSGNNIWSAFQREEYIYPSTTSSLTPHSIWFANANLNFVNSNGQIVSTLVTLDTPPDLITSSTDIENWDFEFLEIDAGTTDTIENDIIQLTYNGRTVLFPANDYYYSNDNIFKIDINEINSKFVIVEDTDFNIGYLDVTSLSPFDSTLYNFGTYNVVISSTKVAEINNNTDREIQNNIYNQQTITNENLENINETQQQTNEEISNLNDSITDDTVESTASDLPSVSINSPTDNSINNIFQTIYNAFCVGEAQNIVLPIPKTNKSITINPNFLKNILQTQKLSWIYNFIQIVWGYFIGRFIVLDVAKKINKLKSGNITEVENSNIKEDML